MVLAINEKDKFEIEEIFISIPSEKYAEIKVVDICGNVYGGTLVLKENRGSQDG